MNFTSLQYFCVTAQERNITRAAERLHITQQTLSGHIAAMEKELGCKLFVRHIPLELTYAGQVFLGYAETMNRTLEAMERDMRRISTHRAGVLRIGIAFTRGRILMPALMERFQRIYPDYEIHLVEQVDGQLQKGLLEGDIDLVIANLAEEIPGIETVPYYKEHISIVFPNSLLDEVTNGDPESLVKALENGDYDMLQKFPLLIGKAQDIGGRVGRSFLNRNNLQLRVCAQSENVETLLGMCCMGAGICMCPENLVYASMSAADIEKLTIVPLPGDSEYQIRFGLRKDSAQRDVMMSFIRLARELDPADPARWSRQIRRGYPRG